MFLYLLLITDRQTKTAPVLLIPCHCLPFIFITHNNDENTVVALGCSLLSGIVFEEIPSIVLLLLGRLHNFLTFIMHLHDNYAAYHPQEGGGTPAT